MAFPFEDLEDSAFERLVVQCMRKMFGSGVQGFATGADGGRDARFQGTAERFPSEASPWIGLTVGQAKHTAAINAHFAEASFGGDAKSSIVSKEIGQLKKLRESSELDHYILFSNRRLGGVAGPKLEARVAGDVGLEKQDVHFMGLERLDELVREYPEILRLASIDPIDAPLLPTSQDLAEVILAIADELGDIKVDVAPTERISYEDKNAVNAMSPAFANELNRRYLGYTRTIEDFLATPENVEVLRRYEAAVEDFQLKIIAKRACYQSFDDVFNYLVDTLIKRDAVLAARGHARLVRAMLFYMYWHCDIGKEPDAIPD